jgi:hypothetical protein
LNWQDGDRDNTHESLVHQDRKQYLLCYIQMGMSLSRLEIFLCVYLTPIPGGLIIIVNLIVLRSTKKISKVYVQVDS